MTTIEADRVKERHKKRVPVLEGYVPIPGYINHDGGNMPDGVGYNDHVIYRTISRNGDISNPHHPIPAKYVNWGYAPVIGRVLDYKVVKKS